MMMGVLVFQHDWCQEGSFLRGTVSASGLYRPLLQAAPLRWPEVKRLEKPAMADRRARPTLVENAAGLVSVCLAVSRGRGSEERPQPRLRCRVLFLLCLFVFSLFLSPPCKLSSSVT